MRTLLQTQFPDHPLNLTQVSNLVNKQKKVKQDCINDIGGDMMAMVAMLTTKKQEDDHWVVQIKVDEDMNRFHLLFFMLPC